uniref:Uncharacterized protein n=1 Tax=Escherichia coli TaxID=562 RepID=A0A2K9RC80_ECOLX|nr:hypothetical protein [Escherichia coli]
MTNYATTLISKKINLYTSNTLKNFSYKPISIILVYTKKRTKQI